MMRLSLVADRDPLFPVQAFFNAIWADDFVSVIRHLAGGVGYGINAVHCGFLGDLDPWEEPFEGARFSLFEEEVVVGLDTFTRFAVEASRVHVRSFPEARAELEEILRELPGFTPL